MSDNPSKLPPNSNGMHELIEQNLDYVRRLVWGMQSRVGHVDDLVQEIFVRVIRGYATFQHQSSFQTWVYRIAMRVIYDDIEKRKRSPVIGSEYEENISGNHPPVDHALMQTERQTAVQAAIQNLSPSLRTTIVLSYFEGLSTEQIAEIEECAESTIYWRLHEAKKQLKVTLEKIL